MADVNDVLERLISDPEFRQALSEDPQSALEGYELSEADREMLRAQVTSDAGVRGGLEQRTNKSALAGMFGGGGGGQSDLDFLGRLAGAEHEVEMTVVEAHGEPEEPSDLSARDTGDDAQKLQFQTQMAMSQMQNSENDPGDPPGELGATEPEDSEYSVKRENTKVTSYNLSPADAGTAEGDDHEIEMDVHVGLSEPEPPSDLSALEEEQGARKTLDGFLRVPTVPGDVGSGVESDPFSDMIASNDPGEATQEFNPKELTVSKSTTTASLDASGESAEDSTSKPKEIVVVGSPPPSGVDDGTSMTMLVTELPSDEVGESLLAAPVPEDEADGGHEGEIDVVSVNFPNPASDPDQPIVLGRLYNPNDSAPTGETPTGFTSDGEPGQDAAPKGGALIFEAPAEPVVYASDDGTDISAMTAEIGDDLPDDPLD